MDTYRRLLQCTVQIEPILYIKSSVLSKWDREIFVLIIAFYNEYSYFKYFCTEPAQFAPSALIHKGLDFVLKKKPGTSALMVLQCACAPFNKYL
jgi:hypothetical protein